MIHLLLVDALLLQHVELPKSFLHKMYLLIYTYIHILRLFILKPFSSISLIGKKNVVLYLCLSFLYFLEYN